MSRIVMVHGAGNDLWGPASIKSRWYPALADGLAWHGVAIEESDVTVAFYGDVFRPDPEDGYRPKVDRAAAVATVEDLVQRLDPHVDLDELTKMLTENHMDRLLAQAAAYLQEPSLRGAARARVEAAIRPDTRIVVGPLPRHAGLLRGPLCPPRMAGDRLRDHRLPLGRRHHPGPARPLPGRGMSPWPGPVVRWTNIVDPEDPAAGTTPCGRFRGNVTEFRVDNGHRVHDPEPYLNNRWTGQAVAAGLADG